MRERVDDVRLNAEQAKLENLEQTGRAGTYDNAISLDRAGQIRSSSLG
jgi:hypothetical protein